MTNNSPQQQATSLEQKRAAYAWNCVKERGVCTTDYVNLAKSAPALVMGNGLMQTLAFYESKGGSRSNPKKPHYHDLNNHIFQWLSERLSCGKEFAQVMNFLHEAGSTTYRQATEETMELLRWLRQFAAAVGSGKDE